MRGVTDLQRPGPGRVVLGNPSKTLLGLAVLASGVLLVILSSQLTWRFDDWDTLLFRPGWSVDTLLDPHYEHITASQIAIYKVLLAAFGMNSLLPFTVVATLVFLLSAVLLYVYLQRRVGDWLALIFTTVVLFLGAAWETLLWPIQILLFGSMACGLGMLLALEREDRIGDRLACVLLVGSMSFFSLGIAFAAGAAVDVAQRRQLWRRRIYIVAIPALLYGLWWLGWGHSADSSLSLRDITTAPLYVLDELAAGVASLLGLVNSAPPSQGYSSLDWGRPLLLVLVVLAGWRLSRLKPVPRSFWIVAAVGFGTWILAALGSQPGRPPDASRYQYASAILILLIAADLMRGIRVKPNLLLAAGAVAAVSLMGNITLLYDSYETRLDQGDRARAVLGAVEVTRDSVAPRFDLSAGDPAIESVFTHTLPWRKITYPSESGAPSPGSAVFSIGAAAYLKAVDDFGSPAYSPAEIATSAERVRQVADLTFAAALGIKLAPPEATPSPGVGPPPSLIGPPESLVASDAGCLTLNASETEPPLLELPPGGAAIDSGQGSGFQVRLRRFASTVLPIDLGTLPAQAGAVIEIPTDRSNQPWKLSLAGSGQVTVCGLARPG